VKKLDDLRIPVVLLERPSKMQRRRREFIKVPLTWAERLGGTRGQTAVVALHLLHQAWRNRGGAFTLANGALKAKGVGRDAKRRALAELERHGLISVERRPKKSPRVTVLG
jgi:hypothetical protein